MQEEGGRRWGEDDGRRRRRGGRVIFTPFQAITEIECFPTSHAVPTECWIQEEEGH